MTDIEFYDLVVDALDVIGDNILKINVGINAILICLCAIAFYHLFWGGGRR